MLLSERAPGDRPTRVPAYPGSTARPALTFIVHPRETSSNPR